MASPHLIEHIRRLVASEHNLSLSSVYLIKARTISKTTSGKVARSWCRRALVGEKLEVLCQWQAPPSGPRHKALSSCDEEGSTDEEVMTPPRDRSPSPTEAMTISSDSIDVDSLTIDEVVHFLRKELAILLKVSMMSLSK